jgi:hypothetical protein
MGIELTPELSPNRHGEAVALIAKARHQNVAVVTHEDIVKAILAFFVSESGRNPVQVPASEYMDHWMAPR